MSENERESADSVPDRPSPADADIIHDLNSAGESTPPGEDGDFYAVHEPEPRVYPTDSTSAQSSAAPPSIEGDGEISLESIYGRRRQRDRIVGREEEEIDVPDLPPLPEHPFRTGLLRPFFDPGFLLKFTLLASSLWILILPATFAFNHFSRDRIKFDRTVDPSGTETLLVSAPELTDPLGRAERFLLTPKGEVLVGAYARYGHFFIAAALVWGIVAVPFFLQIFVQTAAGDDRITDWPQWNQLAGLGQLLWMLVLTVIAGIPGYFLLAPLGLTRFGFGISGLFLFPVFFLSSMETDSLFNLLSRNVLLSLRIAFGVWRRYYLTVFFSAASLLFVVLFFAGDGLWNEKGKLGIIGVTVIEAVLVTFYSLFYFRFLGRFAWIVQDRTDRYLEEREENREPYQNAQPKQETQEENADHGVDGDA